MKVINIYNENPNLEIHSDHRGIIADVFYNTSIEHVALISSEPNTIRGNHYHKETAQHMLILEGELEYWYKPFGSHEAPNMYLTKIGDVITSDPYEIHALRITDKGNKFIVFTEGKRGGKDYESDTFRVPSIIP